MSLKMLVLCDAINDLGDVFFTPLTGTVDPGTFNTVPPGKRFHVRIHPDDAKQIQLGGLYELAFTAVQKQELDIRRS